MKLQFSPRAIVDLQEILEYVAAKNSQAAVRLLDRLEAACDGLTEMPNVGTQRDDLAPRLRALSHGNYVIYFLPSDGVVRIVRVLHGARHVEPTDFRPPS